MDKKYTISATWNTLNEEALLGYSIMSCRHIADEFIVVDHGSVDKTLKVINKCEELLNKPIKIVNFPKEKPEPEAKNLKFKLAEKDWVLWLDADEIFTYKSASLIPKAIQIAEESGKVGIYLLMLEFVRDFYTTCGKDLDRVYQGIGAAGQGHRPRIFKKGINMMVDGNWRKSRLHIDGKIHQDVRDKMLFTRILIHHYDRIKTNKSERYNKVLYHLLKVTEKDEKFCRKILDDEKSKYYGKARNIDNLTKFTGDQPEVFKEFNFYNLEKLAKRSRM